MIGGQLVDEEHVYPNAQTVCVCVARMSLLTVGVRARKPNVCVRAYVIVKSALTSSYYSRSCGHTHLTLRGCARLCCYCYPWLL